MCLTPFPSYFILHMRVLNDFDGIAEKMDMIWRNTYKKNSTNYDQIAFDGTIFFTKK